MTTPANDAAPSTAGATAGSDGSVIDLRDGPTTRVRVERDDNPFAALAPPERMRLIIRVLCELVAYDELDAAEERRRTVRAALDADARPAARPSPLPEPSPAPVAPSSPTASTPTSITG